VEKLPVKLTPCDTACDTGHPNVKVNTGHFETSDLRHVSKSKGQGHRVNVTPHNVHPGEQLRCQTVPESTWRGVSKSFCQSFLALPLSFQLFHRRSPCGTACSSDGQFYVQPAFTPLRRGPHIVEVRWRRPQS